MNAGRISYLDHWEYVLVQNSDLVNREWISTRVDGWLWWIYWQNLITTSGWWEWIKFTVTIEPDRCTMMVYKCHN